MDEAEAIVFAHHRTVELPVLVEDLTRWRRMVRTLPWSADQRSCVVTQGQHRLHDQLPRYDPQQDAIAEPRYEPGEIGRRVAREIWERHIEPALDEMDRKDRERSASTVTAD